MTARDFFEEWYRHFAKNVDENFMKNNVYAKGCFPWHIFSFDKVEHIYTEDDIFPDKLWELLENSEYYVLQGWDFMDAKVEKSSKIKDIKMLINKNIEIYITERNFKWTFIKTHEGYNFLCIKSEHINKPYTK